MNEATNLIMAQMCCDRRRYTECYQSGKSMLRTMAIVMKIKTEYLGNERVAS